MCGEFELKAKGKRKVYQIDEEEDIVWQLCVSKLDRHLLRKLTPLWRTWMFLWLSHRICGRISMDALASMDPDSKLPVINWFSMKANGSTHILACTSVSFHQYVDMLNLTMCSFYFTLLTLFKMSNMKEVLFQKEEAVHDLEQNLSSLWAKRDKLLKEKRSWKSKEDNL